MKPRPKAITSFIKRLDGLFELIQKNREQHEENARRYIDQPNVFSEDEAHVVQCIIALEKSPNEIDLEGLGQLMALANRIYQDQRLISIEGASVIPHLYTRTIDRILLDSRGNSVVRAISSVKDRVGTGEGISLAKIKKLVHKRVEVLNINVNKA